MKNIKGLRKILAAIMACVAIAIIILAALIGLVFLIMRKGFGYGDVYETEELSNYGVVKGNFDNNRPQEKIDKLFPEQIEPDFLNPVYHYKAIKGDTYACEAYLSFAVEDPEAFQQYKKQWTAEAVYDQVYYSNEPWEEYTVSEFIILYKNDDRGSIGGADIRKVFVSEEKQKFVFWTLLVLDGSGATTSDLNYVFSKYNIDPRELDFIN